MQFFSLTKLLYLRVRPHGMISVTQISACRSAKYRLKTGHGFHGSHRFFFVKSVKSVAIPMHPLVLVSRPKLVRLRTCTASSLFSYFFSSRVSFPLLPPRLSPELDLSNCREIS